MLFLQPEIIEQLNSNKKMATFTPILRTSKEYNPVHIRINHKSNTAYIKTDFIVHKSGIQNGKIMDSSVLAKCALLIKSYYDILDYRNISNWTVQELKKYLLTEHEDASLLTTDERLNLLIRKNEELIRQIDTLVQAIDSNNTHKMIVTAFQVGFQRAMDTVGEKLMHISQNKAWKIYGRKRVEGWIADGLIPQKQEGKGKTSTIRYEVARLMELDSSNIKIK